MHWPYLGAVRVLARVKGTVLAGVGVAVAVVSFFADIVILKGSASAVLVRLGVSSVLAVAQFFRLLVALSLVAVPTLLAHLRVAHALYSVFAQVERRVSCNFAH